MRTDSRHLALSDHGTNNNFGELLLQRAESGADRALN